METNTAAALRTTAANRLAILSNDERLDVLGRVAVGGFILFAHVARDTVEEFAIEFLVGIGAIEFSENSDNGRGAFFATPKGRALWAQVGDA